MKTITAKPGSVLFRIVLIALACTCLTVTARPDDWAAARPSIFASGAHGLKVFPKDSTGVLFSLGDDGKEKVIWTTQLVNFPHQAFVAGDGKGVVTIDTWADLGREHSLVVYNDKGKVVGDYRLEDLLSEQEIRDRTIAFSPNRYWNEDASFRFRYDGNEIKYFDITLKWGKIITVNLDSGKLTTGAAVERGICKSESLAAARLAQALGQRR
jgi:hypothetical protein